jgi:hypothetical protein
MAVTWRKIAYYTDELEVNEQEVVGRLTGGNLDGIALGIADNNMVQIDHASVADNDYAKFTADGLEGRSYAEVISDILPADPGADRYLMWDDSESTLAWDTPTGTDPIPYVIALGG